MKMSGNISTFTFLSQEDHVDQDESFFVPLAKQCHPRHPGEGYPNQHKFQNEENPSMTKSNLLSTTNNRAKQVSSDEDDFVSTPLMESLYPTSNVTIKRRCNDVTNTNKRASSASQSKSIHSTKRKNNCLRILSETPSAKKQFTDTTKSPMKVLLEILSNRNYTVTRKQSLSSTSKFYKVPSPLQKASFGTAVMSAVRSRDVQSLQQLIQSGLSPNPCNSHGDSVLDIICKRCDEDLFFALMDCGASLQCIDFFGRTALHHVCWSSKVSFKIVEHILSKDPSMILIEDKVGKTPLDYLSKDKWDSWVEFFMDRKNQDRFWPTHGDSSVRHLGSNHDVLGLDDDYHLPDPENALSADDAQTVSNR